MTTAVKFPFNKLPVELQCEIFLFAANDDHGKAIRLLLVARRIHAWLLPQVYEMVTLGSSDTALFLRTTLSMPQKFFADNVKKLCLSVSVDTLHAERILTVCTGITDLAFWVDCIDTPGNHTIMSLISRLRLCRLSIELTHFISLFSDPTARHAWCDSLTHLDIIFWQYELLPVVPHLDYLPSLTHLSLRLRHNQARAGSLLNILSSCKKLEVMIIYDKLEESTEEGIRVVDKRMVCMPYPSNVVQAWEAQARRDITSSWFSAQDAIRKYIMEKESSYLSEMSLSYLPLSDELYSGTAPE